MQQPAATIVVRDVHFELESSAHDIPSHWHGDGLAVSRFFDSLSLFFPAGERFFIAAVKEFAPAVQDPVLKEQVRQFCAQEGVHSREHVVYNRLLRRFGYASERLEQWNIGHLRWVAKTFSARRRLAITCALEHFTAIFAHLLLSNPQLMRNAHPQMAALWRWHAAEENEHKAVAFDVYRATGGSYWLRVNHMISSTLMFLFLMVRFQFLLVPGRSFREGVREFHRSRKFLFKYVSFRELVRLYAAYYRPSFHPWDLDNRELLKSWRDDFDDSPLAGST